MFYSFYRITNKNKEINKKVKIYIENEYKNKLDRKKTILGFKENYDSELENKDFIEIS